ncbi:chromosome partitioning protein ParA [Endomicrobiia bacterium]|nr:chromosome partitioning protein ParA [Endomicrobiia bacterium]
MGKTRTIAVALKKGGVGKTTTAVNLAAGLHKAGKKVLLVDIDPQASATISCGIDITTITKSIHNLFKDITLSPEDVIIKTSFGMDILPAHTDLAQTQAGMTAASTGELRALLTPIESNYDYIVIDTPPSESFLSISALVYASEILVPVETHFLSLQGLKQLLDMVEQVKRGLNPKLQILGLLPTKVHNRTNMSNATLKLLQEKFPDIVFPINIDFTIQHPQASMAGIPLILLNPSQAGAVAYSKLADLIMKKT